MNEPATSSDAAPANPRTLLVATAAILLTGWAGDFFIWDVIPGVSVGAFLGTIGCLLLLLGRRSSGALLACALFAACLVQSGIELCFTNLACLLILLVVLFGETTFGSVPSMWMRWWEALEKLITGAFRWRSLLFTWKETELVKAGSGRLDRRSLGTMATAAVPALVVAILFAAFLSSGNAVLAEVFSRLGGRAQNWLFEISFLRTLLGLVWMTVGVALFWPAPATGVPRPWWRPIPVWNRPDDFIARWQSLLVLIVANVLFFAANTIDVVYLWAAKSLPEGVSASQFVHEGVQGLITAVILAAVILAIIFQQQAAIARSKGLRVLAIVWILQNVVLIFGVLRRLQLYVQAYQLSELRVYVACFLALVAIGFVMLARHVWKGMNLGKLLLQNALATFALFFALQFCDVGTWVANWNVAQWQKRPGVTLDLNYLAELGPSGWPALATVARSGDRVAAANAKTLLHQAALQLRADSEQRDWRSFQARRDARADLVIRDWTPE